MAAMTWTSRIAQFTEVVLDGSLVQQQLMSQYLILKIEDTSSFKDQ